jgi:hypothetical protein
VSEEQIALASPPVNEAWNRLSPCDDRSTTPGRLVSLDALSGITIAAKIASRVLLALLTERS